MFGVLLFGVHIFGVPVIDPELAIWIDICKDEPVFEVIDKVASGFSEVAAAEPNWTVIDPRKVKRVRCTSGT